MIGDAIFEPVVKGGAEIAESFNISAVWAGRIAHAALAAEVDVTLDVDP
jgi:hypothetical protein